MAEKGYTGRSVSVSVRVSSATARHGILPLALPRLLRLARIRLQLARIAAAVPDPCPSASAPDRTAGRDVRDIEANDDFGTDTQVEQVPAETALGNAATVVTKLHKRAASAMEQAKAAPAKTAAADDFWK